LGSGGAVDPVIPSGKGSREGRLEVYGGAGTPFGGFREEKAHQSGAAHGSGTRVKGDDGGGPVRWALASGVGSVAIVRRRWSSGWHRQNQMKTGAADR
jgi:hypothetical protein